MEEPRQYTAGPLVWTVEGESVVVSDRNGEPIVTYHYADAATADEMAQRAAERERRSPYIDGLPVSRSVAANPIEGDQCSNCGKSYGSETDEFWDIEDTGEIICEECFVENGYFQCVSCGGNFSAEGRSPDDERRCAECDGGEVGHNPAEGEDADWRREVVVGAKVFKRHPSDGTSEAGKPVGPQLTVVKIEDQIDQYGTVSQKDAIALLSDNTWEFRWNLLPDRKLSRWKHAATSAPSVTREDMDRMNELVAKMQREESAAGREGTNTADLTPDERREYRVLREKFDMALDEDSQLGEFHGLDDPEMGNNPPDEDSLGDNPRRGPFSTVRATRVWQDSVGNTHIRYHNTDVVSFNNEWVTLRTGGYDTVTTRARMNQARREFPQLPDYRVYRQRGVTLVHSRVGNDTYTGVLEGTLSLARDGSISTSDMVPPTSPTPERRMRRRGAGPSITSARSEAVGFVEGEWERDERNNPPVAAGRSEAYAYTDLKGQLHFSLGRHTVVSVNEKWVVLRLPSCGCISSRRAIVVKEMNRISKENGLGYKVRTKGNRVIITTENDEYTVSHDSDRKTSIDRSTMRIEVEDKIVDFAPADYRPGKWEQDERNPPPEGTDVLVHQHSTLSVFLPLSGEARDWWEGNVPSGRRWGSGYAVDPAASGEIVSRMNAAGFKVFVC